MMFYFYKIIVTCLIMSDVIYLEALPFYLIFFVAVGHKDIF